ncbi:MAG: nitrate/sulfonate/bicarbonate ABC transporter ATP-binding protein, partial [Acidisphaera sp.]|nr:nitrate/sulfonate/bicarbonate ABC transporter ATP-binding protein [Acidisphaera sp.]
MDATVAESTLLEVRHCRQAYHKDSSADLVVLEDVNVRLQTGEIVALLGRSGSGKSTLLRIVSGLLKPTAGEVLWRGKAVQGPAPGVAMVFQSFALFPWLTVRQNVELGLEAQGVAREDREQRAEAAIDLIGLGGYDSAYPKELSGGMRQRVGLARALVVHPDLLLMDEPFSALDVLTAETLRTDLIDLWSEGRLPVKSVLIVTHNIEEAVLLADRVLVLGSNPGRIRAEIPVHLPRPRDRRSPTFDALVDQLYAILTGRDENPAVPNPQPGPLTHPLPAVTVGGLAGLVEIVFSHNGQTDLPDLADELSFQVDDLLPIVDAAVMLGLLEVEGAQAFLTESGRRWHTADISASKQIFAGLAGARAPLVRTIVKALQNSDNGTLREGFFRDLLRRGFTPTDAEAQLDIAIDWGRYGEL